MVVWGKTVTTDSGMVLVHVVLVPRDISVEPSCVLTYGNMILVSVVAAITGPVVFSAVKLHAEKSDPQIELQDIRLLRASPVAAKTL